MGRKHTSKSDGAEKTVRDIRRATRRSHAAEEKIRIVLEGLRGDESIAELCRREGIAQSLYYKWSKEFLETGRKRLAGDTAREATSDEVRRCDPRLVASRRPWPSRCWRTACSKKAFSAMGETIHEVSRSREAGDHPAG